MTLETEFATADFVILNVGLTSLHNSKENVRLKIYFT